MGHWRTIWNNAFLDFPKLEKTFEVSTPMRFWPWRIGAAHREFTYTKDLDLQRNGGIHLKCSRWRWHMNKLKKLQNIVWNNNRWTHADLQYVHTTYCSTTFDVNFFPQKNGCERIYNLERVCAKWTVLEGHREDDGNHSRRIITHILRMSLLLLSWWNLSANHCVHHTNVLCSLFLLESLWFQWLLVNHPRKPPRVESAAVSSHIPLCRKVDISVRLIQTQTVWMLSLRNQKDDDLLWGKDVFKPLSIRLSVLILLMTPWCLYWDTQDILRSK